MTPRYPLFVALAGIAAVLCLPAVRAEETPASPAPAAAPPTLDSLEAAAPKDWNDQAGIIANQTQALALIESNTLKSGGDFYRASNLFSFNRGEFRIGRTQYELLLAAAAKGEANAEKKLAATYDTFMGLIGRPWRFDLANWAQAHPEFLEYEAAPACIQAVWRDPAAARTVAATLSDNAEIKAIVDADQADRQTNWSTRSTEERDATQQRDKARNARMREIIATGDIHTADDFARAALVMQHSGRFAGYRVAHELAVASLLLGDRGSGRWLVTATYDRMLRSVALDQRFGTQRGGSDGQMMPVDESGISDNQRTALGCPSLTEARKLSSQSQPKPVALAIAGRTFTDKVNGVSATHPENWKLQRSFLLEDNAASIRFTVDNHPKVVATLYYRPRPATDATTEVEQMLREQAAAKEADRRKGDFDGYHNLPDSFVFHKTGEQASLRWIADFSRAGQPGREYLVRIASPNYLALLFIQAPAAEIEALRPEIDAMAETVRLP